MKMELRDSRVLCTCFPWARDPHPLGVQVYRDEFQRFLGFAAAWLE